MNVPFSLFSESRSRNEDETEIEGCIDRIRLVSCVYGGCGKLTLLVLVNGEGRLSGGGGGIMALSKAAENPGE